MSKYIATFNDQNIVIGVQQARDDFLLSANQTELNSLDNELLGKKYENGSFVIVELDEISQPKLITRGMFKLRMTQAERIATRVLALSGTPEGMVAMDFNDLLSDVPVVDLDQQEVKDGINFLESVGVFSEGRASEILNTEITEREKP
jgi:hypothetical protein